MWPNNLWLDNFRMKRVILKKFLFFNHQSDFLLFYQILPGNMSTVPPPLSWTPHQERSGKEHSTVENYGFEYSNVTILGIKMRAGLGNSGVVPPLTIYDSDSSIFLSFWGTDRASLPCFTSVLGAWGAGCRAAGSSQRLLGLIKCFLPDIPPWVRLAYCMH